MNPLLGRTVPGRTNILKTLALKLHLAGGIQHRLLSHLQLVPASFHATVGKHMPHRIPGGTPPSRGGGALKSISNILRINPRHHHRFPHSHGNTRMHTKRHKTAREFTVCVRHGVKPIPISRPQRHPRQMPASTLLQQRTRPMAISHRHRIRYRHHRPRQRTTHNHTHNNPDPIREHPREPFLGNNLRIHHLRQHRRQQPQGVILREIPQRWMPVETRLQQPATATPHHRAPSHSQHDTTHQPHHLLRTHRHLEKPAREQQHHKRHQPR